MSLVIVKASALTIYQNRTALAVNDQTVDSSNNLSQFQATTSEFITTKPKHSTDNYDPQLAKENLTITNHIIRTNIIVGSEGELGERGEDKLKSGLKDNFGKTAETMRAKLQQLLQREDVNDDEEKKQLQQDLQQQMQEQLQQQLQLQQQQQQQQYQPSPHAILTGENAYLLERIDGGSMHEQPIYGTWSAKARRPQAPLLAATATTTTTTTAAATAHLQPSSSIQTLLTEVDENFFGNYGKQKQHQLQLQSHHHYERLPKRSSTMTPIRRELHDQIPRPPRLTSRQPAVTLRRQFSEASLPNGLYREEPRPKPFHYPFDGPLPEEFKKLQQSERDNNGVSESDAQIHNIQDILQKLNLGPGVNKVPPLMMMPTGLHISGSFKNLKSSGLGNFFRGKRNKKQIQMQFPMPIPMQMMPNPYQPSMINIMQQPYQQRIAMEQFYPFKPRSPGDINLLAMQQQQQQQKVKNPHSKGKKQKKKQKDKKNSLASSNLMLQQYPFATAAPEFVFPSMYSPYMSINMTQTPPLHMSKRVPFKVNLDIFPVVPPSKNFKSPAGYVMDEARIVSTMRSPTVLRNPFMEYLTTPMTPSAAAAFNFYNPFNQKQPLYNPIRFPSGAHKPIPNVAAQSNNMQMVFPEQMQKYLQQQQQQQSQQNLYTNYLSNQGHQTPFLPIDCDQPLPSGSSSQSSTGNSKTNPIMVHLNVFPKQKPSTPLSTNPFYSNVPQLQRNTIQEESETSLGSIEPRHQGRSLNDSSLTKIERSDSNESIQQIQPLRQEEDLVDFDHPIVAESSDDTAELPEAAALVSGKPNLASDSSSSSFYYESRPNTTTYLAGDNSNTNYNGNTNENMEQMASEARTASLFRFPVEDLIQFQVHDAM